MNFADLVGIVSVGLGATSWATGPSQSLRSLNLEGFRDEGGGVSLPRYYAHRVAGEFLTESELTQLARLPMFRRLVDETDASADLLEALRSGGTAGDVPGWVESKSNTTAAQQHFIQRMIAEGHRLSELKGSERRDAVMTWLDDAAANAILVRRRSKNEDLGRIAPTEAWSEWMESVG